MNYKNIALVGLIVFFSKETMSAAAKESREERLKRLKEEQRVFNEQVKAQRKATSRLLGKTQMGSEEKKRFAELLAIRNRTDAQKKELVDLRKTLFEDMQYLSEKKDSRTHAEEKELADLSKTLFDHIEDI